MEVLREIITERATAESIQHALDDHGIPTDKLVCILPIEAQLSGGPGHPPRYKVIYRQEADHATA